MFPFCDSDRNSRNSKTRDEQVEDNMKRVEANDAFSICMLADSYYHGLNGFQQDQTKAMELYARAADLGNRAHHHLAAFTYHLSSRRHEEGQVPLRGRRFGRERSGKKHPWMHRV